MFKMKDALGYYEILQVSADADSDAIKKSYRDLAKIWHPDYNQDKDTTDIFQKLSVAYDTLSDKQSRLVYDILSGVYTKENYPDLETITPYKDGDELVNLRALSVKTVKAWFAGYKVETGIKAVSYGTAVRSCAKAAVTDWLAGWWHVKAFIKNIKALVHNLQAPVSKEESLKILLHNMVAYAKENQVVHSYKSGLLAVDLAPEEAKTPIREFLTGLNIKAAKPKAWDMIMLKAVQLVVPAVMLLGAALSTAGGYVNLSESELWNLFAKKKEIDYYQKVDFGGRGQSVDDVVVGKIMSIPVDKSDESNLYHLIKESKVMYGPSADFDVIKTLPEKTTVRLTGKTPDDVWARIMIDNGETGFVYYQDIEQGIGREIPFGSSIIE